MKICVLTSGGDAPGMNAAIRAVVRSALAAGHEVYGVRDGYKGLLEGDYFKMTKNDVSGFLSKGGTALGTARSKEFNEEKYKKSAAKKLEEEGIEYVIAIGGEGTAKGARDLAKCSNIKTIVIPATIDNDYPGTDYTIGFFTALTTVTDALDKIRDTSSSHRRCSIIETMGRNSGFIATFAGICSGAELVITGERPFDKKELFNKVSEWAKNKRQHAIIVIAEKVCDVYHLADELTEKTGFDTRATILGHVQRGGTPVPFDRVLATELGAYAVSLIGKVKKDLSVGIINNELVSMPVDVALQQKQDLDRHFELFKQTR